MVLRRGLYHVEYIPVPDEIKYFVSTGRKDVRGGAAEYLKADPELVERCTVVAGPIHLRENIYSTGMRNPSGYHSCHQIPLLLWHR
jgi:hypothetical protein